MRKVGIIGGSGFIGSYITKIFLENNYEVKVSATNISQKEKYQHLMEFKGAGNLYITELDVKSKNELREFVKDCDVIINGCIPFKIDVKERKADFYDPGIIGIENFLQVIHHSPGIDKVVFIACVAFFNKNLPLPQDNENIKDNVSNYWNNEFSQYFQIKSLINNVVENFIKENPDLSFEISTISPVTVIGKSLSERKDDISNVLQSMFKNRIPANEFEIPLFQQDLLLAMIAVKDVARAVFKVATQNGNHGKNYLLSSESYTISDINLMLNNLPPKKHPKIVYHKNQAQEELGFHFQPAIFPLQEFSGQ